MKNKIHINLIALFVCSFFACKKDKAVQQVISTTTVGDSTGLHFSAFIKNCNCTILWDTTTSKIDYGVVSTGTILRTKGNDYQTEYFRIQNEDGSKLVFSHNFVHFNGGGGAPASSELWQVKMFGKEYREPIQNGKSYSKVDYLGTINHNGILYVHFKGNITLYNYDSHNQLLDSLEFTNVDWVHNSFVH